MTNFCKSCGKIQKVNYGDENKPFGFLAEMTGKIKRQTRETISTVDSMDKSAKELRDNKLSSMAGRMKRNLENTQKVSEAFFQHLVRTYKDE